MLLHQQSWYIASVIGVRTFVVLVALIVGLRLLGKRNIGQMQVHDLAMIMAVANGVQNAMTHGEGLLWAGLSSATVLLLSGWALSHIFTRMPKLESRLVGHPTLVVNNGHLVKDHMRREHLSLDLLMTAIRQHGLCEISEVKMAVLEVDGSLSIVEATEPSVRTQAVERS